VEAGLWAIAGLGGFARLHQLRDQILGDDEWHAIAVATTQPLSYILRHFHVSDNCIPLTAIDRILLERVGLSEWSVRAVPLLAGLLLVVVAPRALRRVVGDAASLVFAWSVATAPLLVYYSRYARPYSIVVLLGFGALVLAYRWLRGEGRAFGVGYALTAGLSVYFLLPSLPAVLAPLAYAVFALPRRRAPAPGPGELAAVGLLAALILSACLGPALGSLSVVAAKAGKGQLDGETFWGLLHLYGGTGSTPLALVLLGSFAAGLAMLRRMDRLLFRLLLVTFLIQFAALLLVRPIGDGPIVLARYAIACLPLYLLGVSIGLVRSARALTRRLRSPRAKRLGAGSVVAVSLLVWFMAGPIPTTLGPKNGFPTHDDFQYDYRQPRLRAAEGSHKRLSRFYVELAREQDTAPLVEAPQVVWWSATIYHLYQRLHQRRVLIGHLPETLLVNQRVAHDGLRLRNWVDIADLAEVRASGARYVVIHKDLAREVATVRYAFAHGDQDLPASSGSLRVLEQRFGARARAFAARAVDLYRRRVGSPVYEDDWVAVFDVSGTPQRRGFTGAPRLMSTSSKPTLAAALPRDARERPSRRRRR
jgi:hypothetical protein